ncbi:phytoene/squalene synthase family protein [Chenggangzhangella methanolivorans]|uniref:phytoene/squalene synthase family protein n=1 Tax=Chenggangzhangella methanolivorans TaxID=1437009 RepID=UPI00360A43E5
MRQASSADLAACSAILAQGSRSFQAASLLLPRRVREPAVALYAFCREADDAVDTSTDPASLQRLKARLDAAYAQRPEDSAVDRAFATAVAGRRIPRAIPDALIEGFSWDAEGRRYEKFDALEAYAVRVAGTVGLMMALVMGARSPAALARALDLGVAMQLTNIARDVGEDARMGRLYLPLDWCAEAGLDADALLAAPRPSPALARVVRRLLGQAEKLYARADAGIAALPLDCRPAIGAARRIYAAIGDEVAAAGHDSVTRRAVVGRSAKAWRLAASLTSVIPTPGRDAEAPALASGRALIEAATAMGEPAPATAPPRFGERVGGVAEAFARLEQARRIERGWAR